MLKAPAFFFPTSVLIIDHDPRFANFLKDNLEDTFNVVVFSQPEELLTFFKNEILSDAPLSNAEKVKRFIDSDRAKNFVSVVIANQSFSEAKGLDVLSKINSRSVQKLLISHDVDQNMVFDAFKARHINAFIPILENGFLTKLKNTVKDLQNQFFIDYSSVHYDFPLYASILADESFSDYLKSTIDGFAITHMVASNDLTRFDLTSRTGGSFSLHVAVEQDFDDFIEDFRKDSVPSTVLEDIKQRSAIPCFPDKQFPDGALWARYMKPVVAVHGERNYYVSCYKTNEGV